MITLPVVHGRNSLVFGGVGAGGANVGGGVGGESARSEAPGASGAAGWLIATLTLRFGSRLGAEVRGLRTGRRRVGLAGAGRDAVGATTLTVGGLTMIVRSPRSPAWATTALTTATSAAAMAMQIGAAEA